MPPPPPPPPSCTTVSVSEYASISLNIPKYPWKCSNKLFWLCQGSEYTWSFYMLDRFLKIPQVLNVPEFWIWHGCICKSYREFGICLNKVQYASIMPEYASISINVLKYASTWLTIAESPWICLNKLFWLGQGSQYASSS